MNIAYYINAIFVVLVIIVETLFRLPLLYIHTFVSNTLTLVSLDNFSLSVVNYTSFLLSHQSNGVSNQKEVSK